ncbi:Polysulfide reductase [Dehalogenimonas alkenigignens]|jgi:Ni/Fe-hydrogenase subunit HybB-like protein|uniref:Polysulfide reductase n=2 Tax=Dehalogenimonas alkenigignens TaxID=1217799 RepID=A0A0W0GHB5_9CHLR|nr:NrfD/PsrC family molybdoenzyme membrane anchor subunit [Dehalogenimonas alkenigignens]KTB47951.1 Polysulfide reductase [Dehalogenimonas alkenigignens]KTB49061.1 Polysulfide reductase [Dehalogenimonas alkenigignens]
MTNRNVPLFSFWGVVQFLFLLGAIGVAVAKLIWGLGAVTNLSDNWPWGLWVAFDVGVYIASAAGGFVLAAIVYIFKVEAFRPLVKPAILIATLGYTIGALGIAIDLGRSPLIIHPLWMWQPGSIMFEVAWCVMMYLTVLYLEFSPNLFARFGWVKAAAVQHALVVPLVIFGILLSFLHQSSLGALFLITPDQHGLWHLPLMGYLFVISAMSLGLSVLTFFSVIMAKSWKLTLRMDLLPKVMAIAAWILVFYLGLRFYDTAASGGFSEFAFDEFGALFLVEVGLGMVLPIILIAMKKVRESRSGLLWASSLIIMGLVLNRVNTLVISHAPARFGSYFPTVWEFIFTLGLIFGAMFAFRLAARYLPLFSEQKAGLPESVARANPEVVTA